MIDNEKFLFQGIVLNSVLKDKSMEGIRQMVCRRTHGFIIKLKGKTEYCFNDKKEILNEGQILYVKKGSSYHIKEVIPGHSIVVNFEASELPEDEMYRMELSAGTDIVPLADKMYRYVQKNNLYGALSCLYGILDKAVQEPPVYVSSRDRQFLEPVERLLSVSFTDPDLKIEKFHELSGVSDAYFRRIFKKKYGVSPAAYVSRERIRLACSYLANGEDVSVSRIAELAGYRDPLYFSRIFKKYMGVSPTEYRIGCMEDMF